MEEVMLFVCLYVAFYVFLPLLAWALIRELEPVLLEWCNPDFIRAKLRVWTWQKLSLNDAVWVGDVGLVEKHLKRGTPADAM